MSDNKINIEQEWNRFASLIVNPKSDPFWRQKMKDIYFAGFSACYHCFVHVIGDTKDDDEAVEMVQDMQKQMQKYADEFAKKHGV